MPGKQETREIEQAAAAIGELLLTAVEATIAERSPVPAQQCTARFVEIDARAAPENDGGPAQLMATLTLVRLLSLVREEVADPERVEKALGWVGEALGTRYAARARYVTGVLESEAAVGDVPAVRGVLRAEFIPALVRLLAGAVAAFGSGDVAWLRALEAGKPTTASYLTGG